MPSFTAGMVKPRTANFVARVSTVGRASTIVLLPVTSKFGTPNYVLDMVDWGDGTVEYNLPNNPEHDYGTAGEWTIYCYDTHLSSIGYYGTWPNWYESVVAIYAWTDNPLVTGYGRFGFMSTRAVEMPQWWFTTPVTGNAVINMFSNSPLFNPDAGDWDLSPIRDHRQTFSFCTSFNPDVSRWYASSPGWSGSLYGIFYGSTSATLEGVSDWVIAPYNLLQFIRGATNANFDVSGFDTSACVNVSDCFYSASSFQGDGLDTWNLEAIPDGSASNFMRFGNITTANYDAFLISLAAQTLTNKTWQMGNAKYTAGGAAEAARTSLIVDQGCTIFDGGPA